MITGYLRKMASIDDRLLNIILSYLSHKIIKRTKVECAQEPLPISFELIFRIILVELKCQWKTTEAIIIP
jgi:hypothetical protein